MVAADAVADEHEADAVILPAPAAAAAARANLPGLIHFRVGVGFVPPFVPSPTTEEAEPIGERLFEIGAEAVFDSGLQRMIGDFRNRRGRICEPGIYGVAIVAHVRVIHIAEQAENT